MVLKTTAGVMMGGSCGGTSKVLEMFFLDLGSYMGVHFMTVCLKNIYVCVCVYIYT